MIDIALPSPTALPVPGYNFHEVRFGYDPTDHLFIAEYRGNQWQNARIEPFRPLTLSPFAACFHYGQTVFEGMKAYRQADGAVGIFRPHKHHQRLNASLLRMSMPAVPEDLFMGGLQTLIRLDQQWVSDLPGYSLYIRPFLIASEARIGARPSAEYLFMIVCSPMASYYDKPLRVKVETQFARAAEGGTGAAKCGGNYGGAFYPARLAQEQGFDQVLWTDGKHHEYLEEAGTMNVMFVLDGTLVTPPLNGSILDGVTRDSVLTLARDRGIAVAERPISYRELMQHLEAGATVEAFGVGTAASVTPIEVISAAGREYFPDISAGALLFGLREELDAVRRGRSADKHGWNYPVGK